jgi:signal transduction histidine kinase
LRSKKNHRKVLATVSHELKNPLQLIVGDSALLHDDLAQACSGQQLEQFQNIEMNARHLLDLINGLVDVAVAHAGNLSVLEEPVDLIATLQEIFAFYRKAAEERGLKFEAGLAADLPTTIVTDPVKFRQIVRHLIDSAMISTEEGEVEVVAKRGKGMLEIVAKERGVGISVKSDRTLCESASRGSDLLRSEIRGGNGLRVVKEFSDLLKGHVHVQSRPGEGSEFTVCLPCE